jgi:hypothetical protein
VGNTKLMNARAEQLRVTQMNKGSKNRRDSCAAEEVCPIRGMSVEKTLATAGVVRDNALIGEVELEQESGWARVSR